MYIDLWFHPQRPGFARCGGQSVNRTGFSPSTSVLPLSVTFHRCSILIFISVLSDQDERAKPANPKTKLSAGLHGVSLQTC